VPARGKISALDDGERENVDAVRDIEGGAGCNTLSSLSAEDIALLLLTLSFFCISTVCPSPR